MLAGRRGVLEIGSGTGQHAVHFSRGLPQLEWQPSEVAERLASLNARIALEGPANLRPAVALDVRALPWPIATRAIDGVFTANTLHIMGWAAVEACFRGVAQLLPQGGVLCVYGPFSYAGVHTSPSNAAFDAELRARDPASGLRDVQGTRGARAARRPRPPRRSPNASQQSHAHLAPGPLRRGRAHARRRTGAVRESGRRNGRRGAPRR